MFFAEGVSLLRGFRGLFSHVKCKSPRSRGGACISDSLCEEECALSC